MYQYIYIVDEEGGNERASMYISIIVYWANVLIAVTNTAIQIYYTIQYCTAIGVTLIIDKYD